MISAAIVHMGSVFPDYLTDCIDQFFLFNKECKLYCLVENDFNELSVLETKYPLLTIVRSDKLPKSRQHKFFLTFNRRARSTWRGGFWRYVIERFFTLHDFMKEMHIENLLHFEYDNLIYQNINDYESIFQKMGKIGLIADCDDRCIPGVVFVPNYTFLEKFTSFYNLHYTLFPDNDMVAFSHYMRVHPECCYNFPVIPQEYFNDKKVLCNAENFISKKPEQYFKNICDFNLIFDAAAFGQYLGGIDSRNVSDGKTVEKFINEHAVYNPSDFEVVLKRKTNSLLVPAIKYQNKEFEFFNLHIHSKKLNAFRSDKEIKL